MTVKITTSSSGSPRHCPIGRQRFERAFTVGRQSNVVMPNYKPTTPHRKCLSPRWDERWAGMAPMLDDPSLSEAPVEATCQLRRATMRNGEGEPGWSPILTGHLVVTYGFVLMGRGLHYDHGRLLAMEEGPLRYDVESDQPPSPLRPRRTLAQPISVINTMLW
jgi:hypothetical protein